MKLKNQRWTIIAEEFAAASSLCYRDSQSLKTLWENLKRKAKLAIAAQADNVYGTGGGKAKAILADPVVETVVGLIRPHVEPFYNMFDDNADIPTQIITENLSVHITDDLEENNIGEKDEEMFMMKKQSSMTTEHDWSQYSPAMLKAPMSAALRQPSQPFSQQLPYESSFLPNTSTPVELQSPVAASSKVQQRSTDSKNVVSRRRPVLTSSASQTLLETKIASLNTVSVNANKEHELEMEILILKKKQEEQKLKQEEEKLKQEEMKTELLRIQIEKETGVQWLFANDQTK